MNEIVAVKNRITILRSEMETEQTLTYTVPTLNWKQIFLLKTLQTDAVRVIFFKARLNLYNFLHIEKTLFKIIKQIQKRMFFIFGINVPTVSVPKNNFYLLLNYS